MYFRFADDVMFLCGAGDVVQGVKSIRLTRRQHWAVGGGAESASKIAVFVAGCLLCLARCGVVGRR